MNARTERDIIKVRVHDGIVGLLYIGSNPSSTDEIVLAVAGTGLSIARSGDKITITGSGGGLYVHVFLSVSVSLLVGWLCVVG